jgi:hypothetical protein
MFALRERVGLSHRHMHRVGMFHIDEDITDQKLQNKNVNPEELAHMILFW